MSKESSSYIAITLGPITRTIEMAENTRGLWAASYMFSYLGKKIIEPFQTRTFLLPYIAKEMFDSKQYNGAGVFPDRYIFKSEDGDFDTLKEHVNQVLSDLAEEMTNVINRKETGNIVYKMATADSVRQFLQEYIKVYFFEKTFSSDENVKQSCEKSLDLLEKQDSFSTKVSDQFSYLSRFFRHIPNSFLTEDAGFTEGFPTIVEISSCEDAEIPKHSYQRYIAIIKADGDSMGKAFSVQGDAEGLSSALLEFNKEAAKIIKDFKGLPVYIGGDDLLFFAPVFNNNESVFSLLQKLDDAFHERIKEKTTLKEHPTLSFGMSVTYYKYPLFEALKLADALLAKAKGGNAPKNEASDILKNNIVFSVQKHSGQTRTALLHKGNIETLKLFNKFIDSYLILDDKAQKSLTEDRGQQNRKKILASIMHGLREKGFMLKVAIKNEETLKNFFINNFNESVHKTESSKDFLDSLMHLMSNAFKEYSGKTDKLKYSMIDKEEMNGYRNSDTVDASTAAIETVYNALQFIHLVNQKNDDKDNDI